MHGDPYSILELPWGASADAIRQAFRRLALRHHPDRNAGDPRAEARFKLISAAYQRLKESGWSLPAPTPTPSPTQAHSQGKQPNTESDVQPQYWPDGAAIHYPTSEELRALLRDVGGTTALERLRAPGLWFLKGVAYLYVLAIAVSVLAMAVLAVVLVFQWIESW